MRGKTRGTETSKYPKEKKTKVIAKVAASEMARVQTEFFGIRGCGMAKREWKSSRTVLEKPTEECESHVSERRKLQGHLQSTTGHEEPCGKPGGPSPKTKYYLVTDREQYREGKVKRTPEGE
jgi:hypothetical protein